MGQLLPASRGPTLTRLRRRPKQSTPTPGPDETLWRGAKSRSGESQAKPVRRQSGQRTLLAAQLPRVNDRGHATRNRERQRSAP